MILIGNGMNVSEIELTTEQKLERMDKGIERLYQTLKLRKEEIVKFDVISDFNNEYVEFSIIIRSDRLRTLPNWVDER